ncbi:MAG: hypothetical protein ABIP07_06265 [Sphingomicrobium sp.]
MKLPAMLFASILALTVPAPIAGGALAQGGTQDQVRRSATCPEGQQLNAQKRKCVAGATTNKGSKPNSVEKTDLTDSGSPQPAEAVTLNGSTSNEANLDAAQQCLDAGGIWTAGVCITAEKQCLDAGGIWTAGVCIKE